MFAYSYFIYFWIASRKNQVCINKDFNNKEKKSLNFAHDKIVNKYQFSLGIYKTREQFAEF